MTETCLFGCMFDGSSNFLEQSHLQWIKSPPIYGYLFMTWSIVHKFDHEVLLARYGLGKKSRI